MFLSLRSKPLDGNVGMQNSFCACDSGSARKPASHPATRKARIGDPGLAAV